MVTGCASTRVGRGRCRGASIPVNAGLRYPGNSRRLEFRAAPPQAASCLPACTLGGVGVHPAERAARAARARMQPSRRPRSARGAARRGSAQRSAVPFSALRSRATRLAARLYPHPSPHWLLPPPPRHFPAIMAAAAAPSWSSPLHGEAAPSRTRPSRATREHARAAIDCGNKGRAALRSPCTAAANGGWEGHLKKEAVPSRATVTACHGACRISSFQRGHGHARLPPQTPEMLYPTATAARGAHAGHPTGAAPACLTARRAPSRRKRRSQTSHPHRSHSHTQ
eukprot:363717-Chlamydomonas_euryale.AAC.4